MLTPDERRIAAARAERWPRGMGRLYFDNADAISIGAAVALLERDPGSGEHG